MLDKIYDVIIIGAGASGLFCAGVAGQKGCSVLVLEHNKTPGRKILISGGGRCNFTNLNSTFEDFKSENPHFCKSSLAQYSPHEFLDLVEKNHIEWAEKDKGQLFCKTKASEINDLLLKECNKGKVTINYNEKIQDITLLDNESEYYFQIISQKENYRSRQLVIATGGLSLKEIGASDFGYQIAKKFGHEITELQPALVPIILNENMKRLTSLSGVSLPVKIGINKKIVSDDLLFTKKGMSGPAILKSSLYFESNKENFLEIDFLPEINLEKLIEKNTDKTFLQLVKPSAPTRFIEVFSELNNFNVNKKINEISKSNRMKTVEFFKKFKVKIDKTEGYRKAEVTKGGINCRHINSKTMESKLVKGLYFIGEVVDVSGQLGGHNFQWAWASGHVCGQSLISQVELKYE